MIEQKLNALYDTYGYRKFKLTKFEPYDLYADNRDFLNSSQLITFTDLDGSLLALKPDVTLSIVKSNTGGEEKVYYNETVYRPKDNHYREILQSGIECIGRIDAYCEAEVIALAVKSLRLVSDRISVRLSDAAFLAKTFDAMDLSQSTREEILKLFNKKNVAGLSNLTAEGRLTKASEQTLRKLMDLYLPFTEGIEVLRSCAISNASAQEIEHLAGLRGILEAFQVLDSVYLDFSLVNSMDYYNGILFQGAVQGIPFTILSGGRYDRLPEKMGKAVGAIGFAMNLDIVTNYLLPPRSHDVDALILYDPEKDTPEETAAVIEAFTKAGQCVRSIRIDEEDRMEHKIRAAKRLTVREAGELLLSEEKKVVIDQKLQDPQEPDRMMQGGAV